MCYAHQAVLEFAPCAEHSSASYIAKCALLNVHAVDIDVTYSYVHQAVLEFASCAEHSSASYIAKCALLNMREVLHVLTSALSLGIKLWHHYYDCIP